MNILKLNRFFFFLVLIMLPLCFPAWLANLMPFNSYNVSLSILPLFLLIITTFFELVQEREKIDKNFIYVFLLFVFLGLYSSLLGFIEKSNNVFLVGNSFTNTLSYFLYPIFMIISAYSMGRQMRFVSQKTINGFFVYYVVLFVFLGLIQLLVIYGPTNFSRFYDIVNFFGFFRSSSYLINEKRICGFFYEPSNVSELICGFIFPYFWIKFQDNKDKKIFVLLCLVICLIFFTKSSTTYLSFALVVLFLLINQKGKHFLRNMVFLLFSLLVLVVLKPSVLEQAIHKVADLGNMSTSYRYSVVYNDWRIFLSNPLGVGNGNQGYYYNNIAYYFMNSGSIEIQNVIEGKAGIIGGGPLWPSVISGYGLIGIIISIFVVNLFIKQAKLIKTSIFRNSVFCFMVNFAFLGFVASNINLNIYCVFALSFLFSNKRIVKRKCRKDRYEEKCFVCD